MTQIPDSDEICRRLEKTDGLIDELFRVLNAVLEWKNKLTGGITVLVWVVGISQSLVLTLLGVAAVRLNDTAETLGKQAVEIAMAKNEINHFINAPRYTPADAKSDNAVMRAWVVEKLNSRTQ
jgi:hypothetical protein